VELLVIGGDTDESRAVHEAHLRGRIRERALGASVRFLGPQSQDVLREYYVAADVTVLPSYYESFGMVASGHICGAPWWARGWWLSPPPCAMASPPSSRRAMRRLAERLADLLTDPDARERLGREGALGRPAPVACVAGRSCREFATLASPRRTWPPPAAGSRALGRRSRGMLDSGAR
jgi:glycosyltransferase involved in cell wall biosynthesis